MNTPGARLELIRELRRIGPTIADAADDLGLTIVFLTKLPVDAVCMLNREAAQLWVCDGDGDEGSSSPEWASWVGLAQVVADDLGLEVDAPMLYEAAAQMCKRSGFFQLVQTA